MKKFLIILCNLIILITLFFCLEYYTAKQWWWGLENPQDNFFKNYAYTILNSEDVDTYFNKMLKGETVKYGFSKSFRKDLNINSKLKPILYMGCSFTYGDRLEEEDTVSAKTAKLTNRPVYNRGGSGWGLDQYLYLSRRNDFYTKIPAPEYIIYIYISDHVNRISRFKLQPLCIEFKPKYKLKNDKLIEIKPKFYDRFFFVENYQYHYNYNKKVITEDALIEKYFTEAQAEFKKHWPDAKLVILLYPICNDKGPLDNSFIWDDLRKKGFIVIDLTKLENYKLDFNTDEYSLDGFHPNAKIWDLILPKILKELGI